MQKGRSKSKGKSTKGQSNEQQVPIIEAEQHPEMLIEQPLNKIDVDQLVKEEERLRQLILAAKQSHDGSDNKLENLSTVLLQALHTKDEQLVAYALEKDDDQLIENTVRNLLTSKVPALLQALAQSIVKRPQQTATYLKWLKYLLRWHLTSLLNAGQQQAIAQIKSVLSNRSRNIVELSKLKGKMSVLLGQQQLAVREKKKPLVSYVETHDNQIINEDGDD